MKKFLLFVFVCVLCQGITVKAHAQADFPESQPEAIVNFNSQSVYDGWILENSENGNQGGILNSAQTTIALGDDAQDRQYRAILSFNTTSLPENIQITSAVLKIHRREVVGTDPFTTHGALLADIRTGAFGNAANLQISDFSAGASQNSMAAFGKTPVNNWHTATLQPAALPLISTTGITQFRLRFQTDDNNDNGPDIIRFMSGDYSTASLRPVLSITYQPPPSGQVVYRLGNDIYRIAASSGASPQNISTALDAYDPGKDDDWINTSPDGNWLVISTQRFNSACTGWACLALLSANLTTREVVLVGGEPLHPDYAAVASGGSRIVYVSADGPHTQDLWVINKQNGNWGTPTLLTGSSTYAYNLLPAISNDGSKLVYSCSPTAYAQAGSAICEVNSNGTGWRVVLTPTQGPGGTSSQSLYQPDYESNGSIIFEADWGTGNIWRLPVGQSTPVVINSLYRNDNSPCVLPNGNIASLWLDRAGGNGTHELKIMKSDGTGAFVLLQGQDVRDIGLGCGN